MVSTSEGTSALATEAAKRAIADAGSSPEEIEIVIVATSSPDRAFPSAAADVQGAIGAKHAVAFDITAACSGFIYALHIVQGFIQAGIYKTALIIGAETLSKVLDWTDRSSCILFGDGCGRGGCPGGRDGCGEDAGRQRRNEERRSVLPGEKS